MERKNYNRKMTYQEALQELKSISNRLDTEELDLDQIEKLLEKSQQLANICRDSLRRVSEKLNDFQQSQFLD